MTPELFTTQLQDPTGVRDHDLNVFTMGNRTPTTPLVTKVG